MIRNHEDYSLITLIHLEPLRAFTFDQDGAAPVSASLFTHLVEDIERIVFEST